MKIRLFPAILVILVAGVIGWSDRAEATPKDKDPVKEYKKDFSSKYGSFITDDKKVDYYKDVLGVVDKEIKIFKNLKTIEDVDKFTEIFFKVRDPDPNTPENEFKIEKDQKIEDIQNEVLFSRGVVFGANGGLTGDMAHVYLLYGQPNCSDCIQKLSSDRNTFADLMVWYYIDQFDKARFRFLFYERGGTMKLFKNYFPILSEADLINPITSPLKEISYRIAANAEDLYELWRELIWKDAQGIFRAALFEFSQYLDVVIEGGNGRTTFGALDPPEPAALTAKRYKPVFLGQPRDLTGRKFFNSSYHSLIPATLNISVNNGRPSFTLAIGYADVDWEIKEDEAELVLNTRIDFQHKTTKAVKKFEAGLVSKKSGREVEEKRKGVTVNGVTTPVIMGISLDNIRNYAPAAEPNSTLNRLVRDLEPGDYVVNVELRHAVTKKSAGGWREEISIR